MTVAAFLAAFGVPSPASAQFVLNAPDEKPDVVTREAFASPYGRALVAELGRKLRDSADPACLQAKGLKVDDLEKRGGELIVKRGVRAMETFASFINVSIYDMQLARNAGVGAEAELGKLRANPDVKRYIAIERPRHLARVAEYVLEMFDRYVLIMRVKLAQVSPISTGDETLAKADPTDQVEAALAEFLKANNSAQVQRFIDLSQQVGTALGASFDTQKTRDNFGPGVLFRGLDDDLAALCIGKRQ